MSEDKTQTLNQMVVDIRALKASVEALETKVDAQSRHTNANLLQAFAQMLEQTKLDFAEIVKNEINQAKEEIKKEVKELVKQELSGLTTEFKALRKEVWRMHSNVLEARLDSSDLEDRVQKLETNLPNQ